MINSYPEEHDPPRIALSDAPTTIDRLFHNPVLIKELRSRMRGARAFIVLTAFLSILTVIMGLLYWVMREDASSNPFTAGSTIGKTLFIGVCTVALIQVMIIVPAQAAGAIAGEKEREMYDLLIVTLLPSWKIVLGKLLAALAYAVLLIVAVVPFMAIAFFFGGVTPYEVTVALVGLLATAVLYGSVGIMLSTVARTTLIATVLTQAINVLILLGVPFLVFVFAMIFLRNETPEWIDSYPFIYLAGSLLALHPFIALGGTEALLTEGEDRLFFPFRGFTRQTEIWIPAPWLAFLIAALIVSAICILIATRSVRRIKSPPVPAPQTKT